MLLANQGLWVLHPTDKDLSAGTPVPGWQELHTIVAEAASLAFFALRSLLQRLAREVIQRIREQRERHDRHPRVVEEGVRPADGVGFVEGYFVALEADAEEAYDASGSDQARSVQRAGRDVGVGFFRVAGALGGPIDEGAHYASCEDGERGSDG